MKLRLLTFLLFLLQTVAFAPPPLALAAAPSPVPLDPSTLARLAGETTKKVPEFRVMQEIAHNAYANLATYGGTSRELLEFVQKKVNELGSASAYEAWLRKQSSISLLDWHRLQSDLDFMLIPEEGAGAELSRDRARQLQTAAGDIGNAFPPSVFYKKMDINIPQEFFVKYPVLGDHFEPVSNVAIGEGGFMELPQLKVKFPEGERNLGRWGLEQYSKRELDFRFIPGTDSKNLGGDTARLLLKLMRWIRYLSENPEFAVTAETKKSISALVDHLQKNPATKTLLTTGHQINLAQGHGLEAKIVETLEKLQLYARDSIATRKLLESYGVANLVRGAGIGEARILTPLYPREPGTSLPANPTKLGEDLVIHHRTSLSAAQNISGGALWISDDSSVIQGKRTAAARGPGLYGAPQAESLSYGDFYARITLSKDAVEGVDYSRNGNWFVLHTSDAIKKNADGGLMIAPMSVKSLTEDLRLKLLSPNTSFTEKDSIVRALTNLLNPEISPDDFAAFRDTLELLTPKKIQLENLNGLDPRTQDFLRHAFLEGFFDKPDVGLRAARSNPEFFRWLQKAAWEKLDATGSEKEYRRAFGLLRPDLIAEHEPLYVELIAKAKVKSGDAFAEQLIAGHLKEVARDLDATNPVTVKFLKTHVPDLLASMAVHQPKEMGELVCKILPLMPEVSAESPRAAALFKKFITDRFTSSPFQLARVLGWGLPKEMSPAFAKWWKTIRPDLKSLKDYSGDFDAQVSQAYFDRVSVQQKLVEEIGTPSAGRYFGLDEFLRVAGAQERGMLAAGFADTMLAQPDRMEKDLAYRRLFFRLAKSERSFSKESVLVKALLQPWAKPLSWEEREEWLAASSRDWVSKYPWSADNPKDVAYLKQLHKDLRHDFAENLFFDDQKLGQAKRGLRQIGDVLSQMAGEDPPSFAKRFPGVPNYLLSSLSLEHGYLSGGDYKKPLKNFSEMAQRFAKFSESRHSLPLGESDKIFIQQMVLAENDDVVRHLLGASDEVAAFTMQSLKKSAPFSFEFMAELFDSLGTANNVEAGYTYSDRERANRFKRAKKNFLQLLREDKKWHQSFLDSFLSTNIDSRGWDYFPWDVTNAQEREFLRKYLPNENQSLADQAKALANRLNAITGDKNLRITGEMDPEARREVMELRAKSHVLEVIEAKEAQEWDTLAKAVKKIRKEETLGAGKEPCPLQFGALVEGVK